MNIGNHGYKIESVIVAAKNMNYLPYLCGVEIAGPRGGKYIIDVFGAERLFREYGINIKMGAFWSIWVAGEMKLKGEIIYGNEILSGDKPKLYTNEDVVRHYSKYIGARFIERKDVFKFLERVRGSLNGSCKVL